LIRWLFEQEPIIDPTMTSSVELCGGGMADFNYRNATRPLTRQARTQLHLPARASARIAVPLHPERNRESVCRSEHRDDFLTRKAQAGDCP
jgi:hypothetical protein